MSDENQEQQPSPGNSTAVPAGYGAAMITVPGYEAVTVSEPEVSATPAVEEPEPASAESASPEGEQPAEGREDEDSVEAEVKSVEELLHQLPKNSVVERSEFGYDIRVPLPGSSHKIHAFGVTILEAFENLFR